MAISSINLSNAFLKTPRPAAIKTSCGKKFHRWAKYCLLFVLTLQWVNFSRYPLVLVLCKREKNFILSTALLYSPLIIPPLPSRLKSFNHCSFSWKGKCPTLQIALWSTYSLVFSCSLCFNNACSFLVVAVKSSQVSALLLWGTNWFLWLCWYYLSTSCLPINFHFLLSLSGMPWKVCENFQPLKENMLVKECSQTFTSWRDVKLVNGYWIIN